MDGVSTTSTLPQCDSPVSTTPRSLGRCQQRGPRNQFSGVREDVPTTVHTITTTTKASVRCSHVPPHVLLFLVALWLLGVAAATHDDGNHHSPAHGRRSRRGRGTFATSLITAAAAAVSPSSQPQHSEAYCFNDLLGLNTTSTGGGNSGSSSTTSPPSTTKEDTDGGGVSIQTSRCFVLSGLVRLPNNRTFPSVLPAGFQLQGYNRTTLWVQPSYYPATNEVTEETVLTAKYVAQETDCVLTCTMKFPDTYRSVRAVLAYGQCYCVDAVLPLYQDAPQCCRPLNSSEANNGSSIDVVSPMPLSCQSAVPYGRLVIARYSCPLNVSLCGGGKSTSTAASGSAVACVVRNGCCVEDNAPIDGSGPTVETIAAQWLVGLLVFGASLQVVYWVVRLRLCRRQPPAQQQDYQAFGPRRGHRNDGEGDEEMMIARAAARQTPRVVPERSKEAAQDAAHEAIELFERAEPTDVEENCPMCLDPLVQLPCVRVPCGHFIHVECMHQFLSYKLVSYLEPVTCPMCRATVLLQLPPPPPPPAAASSSPLPPLGGSSRWATMELMQQQHGGGTGALPADQAQLHRPTATVVRGGGAAAAAEAEGDGLLAPLLRHPDDELDAMEAFLYYQQHPRRNHHRGVQSSHRDGGGSNNNSSARRSGSRGRRFQRVLQANEAAQALVQRRAATSSPSPSSSSPQSASSAAAAGGTPSPSAPPSQSSLPLPLPRTSTPGDHAARSSAVTAAAPDDGESAAVLRQLLFSDHPERGVATSSLSSSAEGGAELRRQPPPPPPPRHVAVGTTTTNATTTEEELSEEAFLLQALVEGHPSTENGVPSRRASPPPPPSVSSPLPLRPRETEMNRIAESSGLLSSSADSRSNTTAGTHGGGRIEEVLFTIHDL